MDTGLERLSLNQITTRGWSLAQAVDGCVRAGIGRIGLWRDKVDEAGGADAAAALVRDAGLAVSSLCRGGFFPAAAHSEQVERRDDNRRAVDEAATLGTDVLVLVCGGIAAGDLDRSRAQVVEGIADLAPYAAEQGVKLAIEPLHPMYCADRSVVVTLAQALAMAQRFPADQVGVVVDAFHVWWDPGVYATIERAAGRILSFQLCDWLDPLPDMLLGRGMMGDGVIDLRRLRQAVDAAGYAGPIEVEIFNQAIWDRPGDEVVRQLRDGYLDHVV